MSTPSVSRRSHGTLPAPHTRFAARLDKWRKVSYVEAMTHTHKWDHTWPAHNPTADFTSYAPQTTEVTDYISDCVKRAQSIIDLVGELHPEYRDYEVTDRATTSLYLLDPKNRQTLAIHAGPDSVCIRVVSRDAARRERSTQGTAYFYGVFSDQIYVAARIAEMLAPDPWGE